MKKTIRSGGLLFLVGLLIALGIALFLGSQPPTSPRKNPSIAERASPFPGDSEHERTLQSTGRSFWRKTLPSR
jgi:hypothetical protein